MRGLYSAVYLSSLARLYAKKRGVEDLDIGKGFDLITGTSTGAIIACTLAAGVSLDRVAELYRKWGIFPSKLPKKFGLNCIWQIYKRPKYLREGAIALEKALVAELGETTLGEIWRERQIALAIPAVEMSRHHVHIFKTPHLNRSIRRDDNYRMVDVCLATTAAPIYRSMARIKNPDTPGHRVFVDGGLWANNPVLVGLIDALDITSTGDRIEIFCLGTCPRPEGELIGINELDRGLAGWQFGGEVLMMALSAQSAFDDMARMLARHVDRDCQIVRFPHGKVPAKIMKYLDLDETDSSALDALCTQAQADVNETLSYCHNADDSKSQILHTLLNELPPTAEAIK